MEKLTRKQQQIFEFIKSHMDTYNRPPSMREIAAEFNLSSTNGVSQHLDALEKKRYIRRSKFISRGIEILQGRSGTMPIIGTIAAGAPIEAIENTDSVNLDEMFEYKDCYLLQVRGSSMIEDCIQEGDYVVVNPQNTAENGQIVVAVINGDATLKRFYSENGRIRLQPANSEMAAIFPDPENLEIKGVVVGILRKY